MSPAKQSKDGTTMYLVPLTSFFFIRRWLMETLVTRSGLHIFHSSALFEEWLGIFYMHYYIDITQTTAFDTPVVGHWLGRLSTQRPKPWNRMDVPLYVACSIGSGRYACTWHQCLTNCHFSLLGMFMRDYYNPHHQLPGIPWISQNIRMCEDTLVNTLWKT